MPSTLLKRCYIVCLLAFYEDDLHCRLETAPKQDH